LRRGLEGRQALAWLLGSNLALGLVGTALWLAGLPDYVSFGGFLIVAALYLGLILFPSRLWRRMPRRAETRLAPSPRSAANDPQRPPSDGGADADGDPH
jgi:hypothetical protein